MSSELITKKELKNILYACNTYNIMEYNLINLNFKHILPLHYIYIGYFKNTPTIHTFTKIPQDFIPIKKISSGNFAIVYNEYLEFIKEHKKKTL